jgi:excinuclease ABC subunit A
MTGGGPRREDRRGGRIEHTRKREVITTADWMIDLGPEGGDKGGEVVAQGTPEEVVIESRPYTGQYLVPLLASSGRTAEGPAMKLRKTRSHASRHQRQAAE